MKDTYTYDGKIIWFAIHTEDYTDDDWGSYDKEEVVEMARKNNATEIAVIVEEDDYCIVTVKDWRDNNGEMVNVTYDYEGKPVWFAIHTENYTADDWGSYDKDEAIKMAKEENATEIIMVDEDDFCLGTVDWE